MIVSRRGLLGSTKPPLIRRARTVTNIKFGASPNQFIKDREPNLIAGHVVIGSGRLTTDGILRTINQPINLWILGIWCGWGPRNEMGGKTKLESCGTLALPRVVLPKLGL
jgi:hypothetical protein